MRPAYPFGKMTRPREAGCKATNMPLRSGAVAQREEDVQQWHLRGLAPHLEPVGFTGFP